MATIPLKLLLSQHTACWEQELEFRPASVSGEHVKPTLVVGEMPTMPRRPKSRLARELSAFSTELQHCIPPVLQEEGTLDDVLLRAPAVGLHRRTGGRGGSPRAKRSPLVSESCALTVVAAAVARIASVVANFMTDGRERFSR